ncbi:hypothetical protein GBA52_027016 [Prunus armeniaca]|nr:hypothetical protein GBA52_027016 [Prunus armeniaca]
MTRVLQICLVLFQFMRLHVLVPPKPTASTPRLYRRLLCLLRHQSYASTGQLAGRGFLHLEPK